MSLVPVTIAVHQANFADRSASKCTAAICRQIGTIAFANIDLLESITKVFPHMTVADNLLTGRHARIATNMLAEMLFLPSVRRQELQHRDAVEKIMNFFGLTRHRHTPVGAVPFGVQKVVGFARALTLEPVVLLLDDPSAGLNRNEREDLARFIIRTKDELALPMIWIEHDMQMVADLADRLQVLDYGKTLAVGSAQEVLRDPSVIQAYLGRQRPG